jgi:hypothetical protein
MSQHPVRRNIGSSCPHEDVAGCSRPAVRLRAGVRGWEHDRDT